LLEFPEVLSLRGLDETEPELSLVCEISFVLQSSLSKDFKGETFSKDDELHFGLGLFDDLKSQVVTNYK
jgi:hypothetical protein